MAWLRLDDGFTKHPKFEGWPPTQRWAWLEVMEYCARYRTGGRIPTDETLLPRSTTKQLLAKAEAAGWCARRDGGALWINDWEAFNPGRAEDVEAAVEEAIAAHPEASANELVKLIGGNRKQVLALIRRFRSGSESGSDEVVPEPVTRARSRPVPSQELPTAAASLTQDPATVGATNGAAAALESQLRNLGIAAGDDAIAVALNQPERAHAWLELAATEAHTNPAAYVRSGVLGGEWPSARARKSDPEIDAPARRERFVHGDGWRLPADELEHQLEQLGAGEDELVGLLEWAADRRSAEA